MTYLSEISLLICWIIMAWWQSRLIKSNRPIYHGWWALLSGVLMVGAAFWAWPEPTVRLGLYIAAQGCGRVAAFNIALNRFRGLSWTYVSPSSTSILDQAELRLFGGKTWLVEILLAIAFITLQFFL